MLKGERHFALLLTMDDNLRPNLTPNGRPPRKQMAPRDMMIVAVVILVITRIDFMNLNSFHVLILALLFLMLMLRWANMRKEAVRKQAMDRYRTEFEHEQSRKYADQLAAEAAVRTAAKAESVTEEPVAETPAEDAVEEKTAE